MPLLDRTKMPPGGFAYREPSLNWKVKNPYLPFEMVAYEIQALRINNPKAGLNPATEACMEALDTFTCTRLKNDPQWCVPTESAIAKAQAEARKPRKCGSCGRKKK